MVKMNCDVSLTFHRPDYNLPLGLIVSEISPQSVFEFPSLRHNPYVVFKDAAIFHSFTIKTNSLKSYKMIDVSDHYKTTNNKP